MYRSLFLIILFIGYSSFSVVAQKKKKSRAFKLPDNISSADKRKVEKATKLLNQGKLFEGENILVELRDENMNHAYFHEALIQIQKQILDKIAYEHPPNEEEGEYFLQGNEIFKPEKNLEENFVENGLARSNIEKEETVENIRLSRKDKRKLKKALEKQINNNVIGDSLLNPIEAAQNEIDKVNSDLRKEDALKEEKAKLDKKKAKKEGDMMLMSYETYAREVTKNSRLATLKHERVDSASHFLRVLLIDTTAYDTLLNSDQVVQMEDALDYYYTRDYFRAAERFKQITNDEPDCFPAHLALANCYYNMGLDSPTFKQMVYLTQTFDERPEGLEGLSRYFLAKGKFKKAAECILKAIMIYPEDSYFSQLNNILKRTGRTLTSQWIRREVYPLNTAKNYAEIIAKEKSSWRYYQNAGAQVYSYASEKGILRSNEITNERYLELYGWKEMLKDHSNEIDTTIKDPKKRAAYLMRSNAMKKDTAQIKQIDFHFARSMQKIGYLDCYVFITLYHHDLYPAFKEFVMLNPEKVEKYFYILLNWEDDKFDKYRVGIDLQKESANKSKRNKKKK